jgi:hypothetical protein
MKQSQHAACSIGKEVKCRLRVFPIASEQAA